MKIFAGTFKEWLVFRRDVAGILVLLLMPAALIVIMALVQDAPFRDYRELRFDLLVADEDGGNISGSIVDGLRKSGTFTINESAISEAQLRQKLKAGKYHVGVIIPKGISAELINSTNHLANTFSGAKALPERLRNDSLSILILFDPAAKPAFRTAIQFAIERYLNAATSRLLAKRMAEAAGVSDSVVSSLSLPALSVRESPLDGRAPIGARLNSVQHNVPAWAIFGMFFIVVSLSGQIIRERDEGSALRLQLIPGAGVIAGLSKIIFYTFVCCLQAVLMGLLGMYLMPVLGLPALSLGEHPAALVVVIPAIAFAATCYGYLIGAIFRTAAQALPFGAISMVILSAIGGIWVPIELLPPILQKAAVISPLHWALEAVHGIILRDGRLADVLPDIAGLLIFGLAAWLLSFLSGRRFSQSAQL